MEAHKLHTKREAEWEEHQVRFNTQLRSVLRHIHSLTSPDTDQNVVNIDLKCQKDKC